MRYYIISFFDGSATQTDSAGIAGQFAHSDDHVVIDAASSETMVEADRHKIPVQEA